MKLGGWREEEVGGGPKVSRFQGPRIPRSTGGVWSFRVIFELSLTLKMVHFAISGLTKTKDYL